MLKNIGNSIGRGFNNIMDWTMDSDSSIVGLGRITLVSMGVLGVVVAPFIYIGIRNSEKLEKTIKKMDQKQSLVFTSVNDCVSQGFTSNKCEESLENAKNFTKSLGTTLSYSDQFDCESVHGDCEKRTTAIPHTQKIGESTITTYTYITNYHPDMVAWQVARDDIVDLSVPLYQTLDPTKAIRQDGKVLDLKP